MITSKACPYWTIKYLQWEKLSSKIGWTWTVLQNKMDIAFQGGTCANIQRVVCSYPKSLLMYISCSLHHMRIQITASVTWAHPRGLKLILGDLSVSGSDTWASGGKLLIFGITVSIYVFSCIVAVASVSKAVRHPVSKQPRCWWNPLLTTLRRGDCTIIKTGQQSRSVGVGHQEDMTVMYPA